MDPNTLRPLGEWTTRNGLHPDNGGFGTLSLHSGSVSIDRVAFVYLEHAGVKHSNHQIREKNIEVLKERIREADLNRLSRDRVMQCHGFVFDIAPYFYVVDLTQFRAWEDLPAVVEGKTPSQKLDLLRKAAESVEYLHSLDKPLVHGDLHPWAFVVSPDREKVILRDFGLGHALRYLIADDVATARTSGVLVPWRAGYSSPQCIELLGGKNLKGDLTPSDDIFAFAGVILKVMSEYGPHEEELPTGPNRMQLQSKRLLSIYAGRPPERNEHLNLPADDPLWELLDSMWHAESNERPSMAGIIQKLSEEAEGRRSVVQDPLPSASMTALLRPSTPPNDFTIDVAVATEIPASHLYLVQTKDQDDKDIWRGRYSDVTKGCYKLRPKDDLYVNVAVKKLKCLYSDFDSKKTTLNMLRREVTIWLGLNHKHVLKLYGYQSTPEPRLVSPWCAQGNLKDFILNTNTVPVTMKRCVDLLLDVCHGVEYLHTRSPVAIVHGDIKPENVVISDGNYAMLCDFGLARIHRGQTGFTDLVGPSGTGTPGYIAPEVTEEWSQEKPADIWALGSLFLTCLSRKEPWHHVEKKLRWKNAVEEKRPSRELHPGLPADNSLWELIDWCWKHQPKARPTINQVREQVVLISKNYASGSQTEIAIPLSVETPQEIPREWVSYVESDRIGAGYFANVYKGTLKTAEGETRDVAIKVLNRCDMRSSKTEEARNERLRKRATRESGTWAALSHPNILPMLGVCYGENPLIITPYCKSGNLHTFMKSHPTITASQRLGFVSDDEVALPLNLMGSFKT
ncbi:hypothetical protein FS837_007048 [Tulasnella sp. UAMH 9824]|nr:hypothetical protein FS837_007048 [Tulasnella sp. UAMH 9824]